MKIKLKKKHQIHILLFLTLVPKDGEVSSWTVMSAKEGFADGPVCQFNRIESKTN